MSAPARAQALRMRPAASCSGSDANRVLELRGLARLLVLAVGALVCAPWAFASSIHILFVGNSFTHGRYDPVRLYNAANVHDLNCLTIATCSAAELPPIPFPPPVPMLPLPTTNTLSEYGPYGGIPGIFKQFTMEAGLDYDVSLDTISAATLLAGFNNQASRRALIADAKWDIVVLQEQSFLPLPAVTDTGAATRGIFANFQAGVNNLTAAILASDRAAGRSNAEIYLYETQPLASYTYTSDNPAAPIFGSSTSPPGGLNAPYVGDPIETMTDDLHNAYFAVATQNPAVAGVAPAGDAWLRAIETGVALRNPYLAIEPDGQIDLWDSDPALACCTTPIGYHPSSYGSYLSGLVLFATITGAAPMNLGANERVAADLGISPDIAGQLQRVAQATVICQEIKTIKLAFGKHRGDPGYSIIADADGNGVVDFRDVALLLPLMPDGTHCR
jgi:hypothetical protein